MKTILIVRHAKSSWDHHSLSDHDRPLNARGERDAPRMADYLVNNDYLVKKIVASTAKRAQQTARIFQSRLNIDSSEYHSESELYHAGMKEWISVLERYWNLIPSDSQSSIGFFAHNPGITNIVNWLCDEDIFNIPTCGMALIGFPDGLERIDSGVGTLIDYQVPKHLDSAR